jgi:hypothetical protein
MVPSITAVSPATFQNTRPSFTPPRANTAK